MTPRLALLALPGLCALAFAPAAALADARAGAQLSGFGWSLIDLAPGDGVEPWVRFEPLLFDSVAQLDWRRATASGPTDAGDDYEALPGSFFPTRTRRLDGPGLASEVAQSGDPAAHTFTALARSRAANGAGDGVLYNAADAYLLPVDAHSRQAITLSPFTQLLWTGQVHLEAGKDARAPGLRHERGTATASMRVRWADTGEVLDAFHGHVDTLNRRAGTVAQDFSVHLSFANLNDSVTQGDLSIFLAANSRTSTAPVPEAGSWALLAGGFIVVGGVAARRRPARA